MRWIKRIRARREAAEAQPPVYHYTVVTALVDILKSGELRPATALLEPGERPAVWLTRSETWEETANKRLLRKNGQQVALSAEETAEVCGGLVRIQVPPDLAPWDWAEWKRQSGLHPHIADLLRLTAEERGADPVGNWRVSFEAIPARRFLGIQQRVAPGVWERIPGS